MNGNYKRMDERTNERIQMKMNAFDKMMKTMDCIKTECKILTKNKRNKRGCKQDNIERD